jgi:SAM-dependent methyltransferase
VAEITPSTGERTSPADAMAPYGEGLKAFQAGDEAAEIVVCRDDDLCVPLPIRHFFRGEADFSAIERTALELCRPRILDIGAGAGIHSAALQARGLQVRAIDVSPAAVEVMVARGIEDVVCGDVLELHGESFETLLLLGHGIGFAADPAGLDRFLAHARTLLCSPGRLLLDSLDVTCAAEPVHRAYHEANRKAGRYVGETRIRFERGGRRGPWCGWLHVDPDELGRRAAVAGFACRIVRREPGGEYLALLSR